ncbi:hypothetical protein NPIL_341671 [Nephila pilipes]|uniref:HTH CENPB-type domain-containing protein n=1 Tax=Nephila pilipes TaxID=299642 RepID=A0A8X6QLL3_NEPPI|nr:hypothetical protein NPIL_341671 [Nephila pilipes]
MPDIRARKQDFQASKGWFENFKKRFGIRTFGEIARPNSEAEEKPPVIPDIASIGKLMNLNVSKEAVNKPLNDQRTELTTEEFQHFNHQQQKKTYKQLL